MGKRYKRNNIKSTWKKENYKVVFTEPEIQAWESVVYIKDVSEILYYYYTMTVYRKIGKKWEKEFCSFIWDFPAIRVAAEIIRDLLKDEDFENGTWQVDRNDSYGMENVWYKKSYSTGDIMNEDFYAIEKTVRISEGDRFETYALTIGSGNDDNGQGADIMRSITLYCMDREEIEEFLNVIESFMKKSIEHFNKQQREMIDIESKANVVKHGKLYEYDTREKLLSNVCSLYIPGDEIEFTVLSKKNDEDVFIYYRDCVLESVEESKVGKNGYIVVAGGFRTLKHSVESLKDRKIKIPVELITYIMSQPSSDKLRYSKTACAEDFVSILDDEERHEFADGDIETLENKWSSAVTDRTWMMRDEHGFKNTKKTIKKAVKLIKKQCEEEVRNADFGCTEEDAEERRLEMLKIAAERMPGNGNWDGV